MSKQQTLHCQAIDLISELKTIINKLKDLGPCRFDGDNALVNLRERLDGCAARVPLPCTRWMHEDGGCVRTDLDGAELRVVRNSDGLWNWTADVAISLPFYNGNGDGGYDQEDRSSGGTAETLKAAQQAAELAYSDLCGEPA